jgi:hypothetical protein
VTALASPTCDLNPLLKIDKEEKRIQEVTNNFHCFKVFLQAEEKWADLEEQHPSA